MLQTVLRDTLKRKKILFEGIFAEFAHNSVLTIKDLRYYILEIFISSQHAFTEQNQKTLCSKLKI